MNHYILDEQHRVVPIQVWHEPKPGEPIPPGFKPSHPGSRSYINEANLLFWGAWFEYANRHARKDDVGPFWISTVFLGIDHGWDEGSAPVVFETMAFDWTGDSSELDFAFKRYSSWDEAVAGHEAAVAQAAAYVREKGYWWTATRIVRRRSYEVWQAFRYSWRATKRLTAQWWDEFTYGDSQIPQ